MGLDEIPVDDAYEAYAGPHQRVGDHGPQRAAAAKGDAGLQQLALAFFEDATEAHLPAVAFEGGIVGHGASPIPYSRKNSCKNCISSLGQPSWLPKPIRQSMSSRMRFRSGPCSRCK